MTDHHTSTGFLLTKIVGASWAIVVGCAVVTLAAWDTASTASVRLADSIGAATSVCATTLVVVLALHLVSVWRAGRARTAMAGAIGGLFGAVAATGVAAFGDGAALTTNPTTGASAAPAVTAATCCVLVWVRALLARRGSWRYAGPDLSVE